MPRWVKWSALVLGVLGFAFLVFRVKVPYVVRDLPWSARDVHWHDRDSFPDWKFSMSAALSEEVCLEHLEASYSDMAVLDERALTELGEESMWATQWGGSAEDWELMCSFGSEPRCPWWHPAPVRDATTRYRNNGGAWELVQCSQGRIFYESFSH